MAKLLKSLPFLLILLVACGKPIRRDSTTLKDRPKDEPSKTEVLTCTPGLKTQHLDLIKNFNILQKDISDQAQSSKSVNSTTEIAQYKERLKATTQSLQNLEKNCNQLLGTIQILEEKKTYFKTDRLKDNLVCSYFHDGKTRQIYQSSPNTKDNLGIAQYCVFNQFVGTVNNINEQVRSKFKVKNIEDINSIELDPAKIVRQEQVCQQYSELVEGINLQRTRVNTVNDRLTKLRNELDNSKDENIETLAQEFENKYFYLYSSPGKEHTDLYSSLKNNCTMLDSYKFFDYDKCQNSSNLKTNAVASKKNCNFSQIESTRNNLLPTYNKYKKVITKHEPGKQGPTPGPTPRPTPPKKTPEQLEKEQCRARIDHGYVTVSNNFSILNNDITLVETYKQNYAPKKKITFMLYILQTYKNSMNKNLSQYSSSCADLKNKNKRCFDQKIADSKKYEQYCKVQAYSDYSKKTLDNSVQQINIKLFKKEAELKVLRPILENLKNEILFDSSNKVAKDEYKSTLARFTPSFTEFLEICSNPYFLKLDAKTLNISRLQDAHTICKAYTLEHELNDISLRDFK